MFVMITSCMTDICSGLILIPEIAGFIDTGVVRDTELYGGRPALGVFFVSFWCHLCTVLTVTTAVLLELI